MDELIRYIHKQYNLISNLEEVISRCFEIDNIEYTIISRNNSISIGALNNKTDRFVKLDTKKYSKFIESLKNDYQSGIVSARYNNKIMNDDDVITKNGKLIIYDLNSMEGNRIYERGLLYLFEACATEVLGKDVKIYVKFSIDRGVFCKIDRNVIK